MAISKCENCGGNVSDKAKACPHCGSPIDLDYKYGESSQPRFNQNQEAQVQPERAIISEPVEYYEEPERKYNTGLIVTIVLGLLVLLGVGGWFWSDNNQKLAEKERQMAVLAEKARQDSIAAAELRERARQDSIMRMEEMANSIKNEVELMWDNDQYLSPDFQKLIKEDEWLTTQYECICCIDYDLWNRSQEGYSGDASVVQVSDITETTARVMVRYHPFSYSQETSTAILLLIKINNQWRVDEIIHGDIYEKRELSKCIKKIKRQG